MNRKRAQGRFIFFCIAPAAVLVTLFIFIPTINVFRMSLYRMGGITNRKEFVGLYNFKSLLADKNFLQAMQNSIAIIVLVTLCTVFFAILFAAILSRGKFKGKNFFRIIFYIPNILSIVVIAGIFGAIYNPSTGLLNTFLNAIGLGRLTQQWMGNQNIVLYSVIFALVWQAIGSGHADESAAGQSSLLPEDCRYIVPMIDARRMEVYTAVFSAEGKQLTDTAPVVVDGDSFADILKDGPVLFIGDGAEKCRSVITSPNACFRQCCPKASAMLVPATGEYKEKRFKDVAYFEPFYLKEFVATVSRKKLF